MQTGDGLLVRLLPTGTISLAAFAELCAAARNHGNGIMEITARGSIQVRGLNAASAPRFADSIAALDIAAADGIAVLTDPLAGLAAEQILDANALAADLRRALARISVAASLAAKISVAVDGGGALNLDGLAADVRLRAMRIDGDDALLLSVGGDGASAAELGAVALPHGVDAALRLLEFIARHGRGTRAKDIVAAEGIAAFRSAVADLLIVDAASRVAHRAGEAIGMHRLRDGSFACGIGVAFGHADADLLRCFTEVAQSFGAGGMRPAPDRTLMIVGLAQDTLSEFAGDAERLGFIVHADDLRRRVIACAGAPVCASGHLAARDLAPVIASSLASLGERASTIHISGCAKGCAHPAPAALTIVGTAAGCALVENGSARDAPFATVPLYRLPDAVASVVREGRHV